MKIYNLQEFNFNDKKLIFKIMNNNDLYWQINSKEEINNQNYIEIIINEDNSKLFDALNELFYDIKNFKIFDPAPAINRNLNQKLKILCLNYNYAHYQELYNNSNKTITWYSDEQFNNASYLIIQDNITFFTIRFYIQQNNKNNTFNNNISVKFKNSNSRYNPFNILFLKMYYNIIKDDTLTKKLNISTKKHIRK